MKNLFQLQEHLTFDDILLRPQYSEILPSDACLETHFSKNITLNIPLVSSAMDTVTESQVAITMACLGGLGVIHKNLTPELQAIEVQKVKLVPTQSEDFKKQYPSAILSPNGTLRVAAAIGVGDFEFERAKRLARAGVDALVIDTAHGHSQGVMTMIKRVKDMIGIESIDVVAGNVATSLACLDLIRSGADGVKVGIGPGSICTTRIVAGIGVPQVSALNECCDICHSANIPYIADGGVKFSGDIVKALALGAKTVMIGSLFAGSDQTPGDLLEIAGKKYKSYRGMGSLSAMQRGSKDRYGQGKVTEVSKLVPEGVEGAVEYRGNLEDIIFQLIGGIRSGMGYVGAKDLSELWRKAEFIRISKAAYKESHAHDIMITKRPPNYKPS